MKKTASLFGVPVLLGGKRELLEAAETCLQRHGILHTVNPVMLSRALSDPAFRRVLRDGVNIPDGVGVKFAFRLRGERTEVFPGVELAEELFTKAGSVCFYGGKAGVAERAYRKLSEKTGKTPPALLFDGYGTEWEKVATALKRARPELVLVALGTPRQERVMQKLYDACPHALYVGVGGSLDVYAGEKKRAPRKFRAVGAEWLWRMASEPGRLKDLPRLLLFSAAAVLTSLRGRRRKNGNGRPRPAFSHKNIVKN